MSLRVLGELLQRNVSSLILAFVAEAYGFLSSVRSIRECSKREKAVYFNLVANIFNVLYDKTCLFCALARGCGFFFATYRGMPTSLKGCADSSVRLIVHCIAM